MGCAIPLAIGAHFIELDRTVVSFCGDAGLLMVAGELTTAKELNLNTIFVILVDASLALIELKQRQRQLTNNGVDFAQHDLVGMVILSTPATNCGLRSRLRKRHKSLQ